MADYYPLLTRAIRNLPDNSPEARQAIFLRARDALERQLRSVVPRLTDADIVRELLNLEDVIKRIDAEMDLEAATAAAALRLTEEAVAKLTPSEAEAVHGAPNAPSPINNISPGTSASETLPTSLEETHETSVGQRQPLRPRVATSARVKMPDGFAVPPGSGALKSIEPETSRTESENPASPQAQRIRLPDGSEAMKRKKRLGLFAAAGCLAIMAMAALALYNKERPDRYRQAVDTRPRVQSTAGQDASKREGRLTEEATPQSPTSAPSPQDIAPQRPVTSVPIQAPLTPPAPPTAPAQSEQPALPVMSRAYMILELPGRSPNQYEGRANWSFEPDPASRSPQKALRTTVEFADAGLSLDVSMARATDGSLNASHIVTIAFTPREGQDAVREMSAVEWREREGQVGTTLAGTLVPIQDNFFMIGLDATEAGKTRNLDLLRTQRWMVFEIRMANGRRGAFLIERGSSGEKAIAEALAVWR